MRHPAILAFLLAAAACGVDERADADAQAHADAQALTGGNPDARPPQPIRPVVTGIFVPDHREDTVDLAISVRDTDSPTVDLLIVFTCDGASDWSPITTADPLTALAAGPTPTTHPVRWRALADVDLHAHHDCMVAAIATDPGGISSETLVAAVAVDP